MNTENILENSCGKEKCMYWKGEVCALDLARYREHESNDSLNNIPCVAGKSSYAIQQVEERLIEEDEKKKAEQVRQYASYAEYKSTLDRELTKTAESFVRIGYLLKVARDTPILRDSGYDNVVDFAQAEYGIDKSTVSRFIRINTRFSEGGHSDRLQEQYQGFGYAKLSLMLSLPDEINGALTPEYSKAEIQAIKDEVDEERTVSDIERMLEDPGDVAGKTLIERLIDQLGQDDPDLYAEMYKILSGTWSIEDIKETMAPAGQKSYSIRLPKNGRIMLMLDVQSDTVRMVNARSGETETCGWGELGKAWAGLTDDARGAGASWEDHYGRKFPKVAPVQPESVTETAKTVAKPQKTAKVQKAPEEWASAYKPGQKVKTISTGNIGELIRKTDKVGRWEVQFSKPVTYRLERDESQFEAYEEIEEQVQQETLHSVEASIPPAAPEGAAVDRFHQVILDHIDDLKRNVLADEWKMAKMDLEMIQDAVSRGEDMAEMEDDE